MLLLSLFILGFSSLVAQIVLTRELIVSFYGNEFFIGWILFGWLFWTGAGSFIFKTLRMKWSALTLLSGCHLLTGSLLPLSIVAARFSKGLFVRAAGQIPDLLPAALISLFSMAPLCLVLGLQFMAASEYHGKQKSSLMKFGLLGRAYFYEALGFVAGGIIFSYILVFLNEFLIGAILIFLNAAVVIVFLNKEKADGKKYLAWAAIVIMGLGFLVLLNSARINLRTAALRFPNEQLLETKNTIYGQLALTRTADQLNFYESGLSVGTDKDKAFNEHLVHLPMLSHTSPQKILLIGSGISGALSEILKHSPKDIFYAELDPALTDLAGAYIPELRRLLDQEKIHLIREDPWYSLKYLENDFDVIILNLPNPSTALINRYFTDEFFREVTAHLKSDGLMATHLQFSAETLSRPLEDLGAGVYKTIRQNFSDVVILPEEVLFILASQKPLPRDPQELVRRMNERNIQNYFLNSPALKFRYGTDRVKKTEELFNTNQRARINYDLHPQGYLYQVIYGLSLFHQGLSTIMTAVMRINYVFIVCFAIFLVLMLSLRPQMPASLAAVAMSVGGFSLMSAELIVIYIFQVFYGNLYYSIAWIITAFMAGLALGTYLGERKSNLRMGELTKIHGAITGYFGLIYLFLLAASQFGWIPGQPVWFMLGAGIGVLIGLEFCYANKLYFSGQGNRSELDPGMIYTCDLMGSCLGALLVSIFLIPAFGVLKTLFLLMMINMVLAGGLFRQQKILKI